MVQIVGFLLVIQNILLASYFLRDRSKNIPSGALYFIGIMAILASVFCFLLLLAAG